MGSTSERKGSSFCYRFQALGVNPYFRNTVWQT
jgi:hypothetical protein